ncbi:hypothetical protein LTR08_008434 [Meristemomyces frigidus]|nr:hypothetical protein LTR08_008434 [Meristemomyces frigidus]
MADNNLQKIAFCKYLLAGKCAKGAACHYRHDGPERPISTAYAFESTSTAVDQNPYGYLISGNAPPDSYTQALPSGVKATFVAGMVPTGIEFLDTLRPKVRVEQVTSFLEITWYHPIRNIYIECRTEGHALQILGALRGQVVRGVMLECISQRFRHGERWTVQVTNAIQAIRDEDILMLFPAGVPQPQTVQSGPPLYNPMVSGLDVIAARVASLTNRQAVGASEVRPTVERGWVNTYLIEFKGSPNLKMLARALHGKRVRELGDSPIYVHERLEVVLNVDSRSFNTHAGRLRSVAANARTSSGIKVHFDNEEHASRVKIIMGGKFRGDLMNAKAAIDRVFIDDMASTLQRLQTRPPTTGQTHRIRLTKTTAYPQVLGGGLREAQDLFGKTVVAFDDESDPPAVLVRGNTNILRRVQTILFPDKEKSTHDIEPTCEICYGEVINSEMVTVPACNHKFCKDCIANYCTIDPASKFPLRCASSDCDTLLPMQLIRNAVGDLTLPDVLQHAVQDHFLRHPVDFALCPGPDCAAVYTLKTNADEHTCPSCFTIICVRCKVGQHFGETCEQYRESSSAHQRAMEVYIREGNAKRCTNCATIVEKIGGCNNMECPGCKAHFCFTCMEVLPTHQAVYQHLLAVHGNYGDREANELVAQVEQGHNVW